MPLCSDKPTVLEGLHRTLFQFFAGGSLGQLLRHNFYETPLRSAAVRVLDKYDVRYVYVGELERGMYSEVGLVKFEQMESDGLVRVYPTPGSDLDTPVVIYEYTPVTR